MKNISAKYINYYLGAFTFSKNFKVKYGRKPSTEKDAENILIEILKSKIQFTITDILDSDFTLDRPSYRSSKISKEKTEKARKITGNSYFKFESEDGTHTFNKRAFLETLTIYQLKKIAKPLKIPRYTTMGKWQLTREIEKQPEVEKEIFKFINENKLNQISDEDIKFINSKNFHI